MFSFKLNFIPAWNSTRFIPGWNSCVNRIFFITGRVSYWDEISSCLHVNVLLKALFVLKRFQFLSSLLEGVYTWKFIPGWNSSRDEIIPVDSEMSLTVYTFLPRWNFIPGSNSHVNIIFFIPGWDFISVACKRTLRLYRKKSLIRKTTLISKFMTSHAG